MKEYTTDRSEPTTAADRLRDWINGGRIFTHAEPNRWLDEALAEAAAPRIKERDALSVLLDYEQARKPDSEALRLLRARIDAEPFFPKGDGPSIGNAAAFRDYKRRILAALPPSDPPALHAVPNVTTRAEGDWTQAEGSRPVPIEQAGYTEHDPPSDPPALAQPSASIDVERLAQALFYSIGPGNLNGYPYDDEYRAIFRENADDTLAEYARLSAQAEFPGRAVHEPVPSR